jgi:hypothetical protein
VPVAGLLPMAFRWQEDFEVRHHHRLDADTYGGGGAFVAGYALTIALFRGRVFVAVFRRGCPGGGGRCFSE